VSPQPAPAYHVEGGNPRFGGCRRPGCFGPDAKRAAITVYAADPTTQRPAVCTSFHPPPGVAITVYTADPTTQRSTVCTSFQPTLAAAALAATISTAAVTATPISAADESGRAQSVRHDHELHVR